MPSLEEKARVWISEHASITTKCLSNGGIVLDAMVDFDVPPSLFFEIITHPQNYVIVRSVDTCLYRKVLFKIDLGGEEDGGNRFHRQGYVEEIEENGEEETERQKDEMMISSSSLRGIEWENIRKGGGQTRYGRTRLTRRKEVVLVSNRSRWDIGPFHGFIQSHMGVYQDSEKYEMMFTNAPGRPNKKVKELFGRWKIEGLDGMKRCRAMFHQRIVPKGLPRFLLPTFARVSAKQVQHTFEDFAAEIFRIEAGNPTLSYNSKSDDECGDDQSIEDEDPSTILAALEEASLSSGSEASSFQTSIRLRNKDMVQNSHEEPASFPITKWSSTSELHSIEWYWKGKMPSYTERLWDSAVCAWYELYSELRSFADEIVEYFSAWWYSA